MGRPGNARGHAVVRGPRRAPLWLRVPALAAAALALVPLVYLFARAAQGGGAGWLAVVGSAQTLQLLRATLLLAAGVAVLTVAIALPLAWVVVRTDLPGRRFWAVVGALPLVFPSYVAAYSFVAVLGPRGYAQGWLAPWGVERLPEIAYGYSGALLALALFNYPYLFLLLVAALRNLDPALEESSRSLGVGRWRTFLRVQLPQLVPALSAGTLLVVLYTLSDFGAVSIARYNTFTLAIYNAYRTLFDRTVAASLATVLVVLTLALLLLESRGSRHARAVPGRTTRRPRPVALGGWRWPSLLALGGLSTLTLGVPLGVIGYWGWRALASGRPLGRATAAAWGSLSVSMLAALAAVVLAIPVAAWAQRFPRQRLGHWVERVISCGYALPGLVIALSLVFLAARYLPSLYQTVPLLIAAYLIRFLPQAVAAARSALGAVPVSFEEAARSLGSSPWRVLRTVTMPLMRPGLLAGGGLVFLTVMKELPATLLLRPTGFETLATRIWTTAGEGIYSEAALPALLLLLVSAPPVYLLIIRPVLAVRGATVRGAE